MNISRLLNSSKFQGAVVASLPAVATFVFAILEKTPLPQIQPIAIAALAAAGIAWGAAIHGTATEDAAAANADAAKSNAAAAQSNMIAATAATPSLLPPAAAATPPAAPAATLPTNPAKPAGLGTP